MLGPAARGALFSNHLLQLALCGGQLYQTLLPLFQANMQELQLSAAAFVLSCSGYIAGLQLRLATATSLLFFWLWQKSSHISEWRRLHIHTQSWSGLVMQSLRRMFSWSCRCLSGLTPMMCASTLGSTSSRFPCVTLSVSPGHIGCAGAAQVIGIRAHESIHECTIPAIGVAHLFCRPCACCIEFACKCQLRGV